MKKVRHTWDDAVDRWQREKPRQASDAGDFFRLQTLGKILSGKHLDEITTDLIEGVIADLSRTRKSSTVNRHLCLIRVIMRRAYRLWGWVATPVPVRTLREPVGRLRRLTGQEITRLLASLPTHQRDMAEFALATGFRASNVCRLEWSWVDLQRGVISIPADKVKNRRTLSVPINRMAAGVLKRRLGTHGIYVFTYRGDIVRKWANRTWRESVKKAGLGAEVTPHVLRHTWASAHVMGGTRLAELKELGGWRSDKLVLRYTHLSVDHLKSASENVVSYFGSEAPDCQKTNDNQGVMSGAGNETRTRDPDLGKVERPAGES